VQARTCLSPTTAIVLHGKARAPGSPQRAGCIRDDGVAGLENCVRQSTLKTRRGKTDAITWLERSIPAILALTLLALWQWAAITRRIPVLFFPAPSVIARALVRMTTDGRLSRHLGASLTRLLSGFVVGAGPGLLLGLVTGRSRRLRALVDPFIALAHPLPKVSLLPLTMVVFGIGDASKVVTIAIACFFPMLISAMAAVQEIPVIYFEVAENYGAHFGQLLARVVAPATLPLVLSAARLSLNTALVITLAVELAAAQTGLGALVWLAWETLHTEDLYAVIAVTAILGLGTNLVLQYLNSILAPWRVEPSR
jgi:ABC-type nitrate/sulfonate/bicarbonate transport system permease component